MLVGVVVAILVAASFLFGSKKLTGGAELADIQYELIVPLVTDFEDAYLAEGDVVSKLGSGQLGTVVSFSSAPSKAESMRADGTGAVYDSTIYRDVTIIVKAKGEVTSQGFIVGGVPLRNNTVITIGTPRFEGRSAVVNKMTAVD